MSFSGLKILFNFVVSANAFSPIDVTVEGIVIDVIAVCLNAFSQIDSTPSGIVIPVNCLHLIKASLSIDLTA